jgi:hypothetical protein
VGGYVLNSPYVVVVIHPPLLGSDLFVRRGVVSPRERLPEALTAGADAPTRCDTEGGGHRNGQCRRLLYPARIPD